MHISLDCVNISGSDKTITVAPLNRKWTSNSNPSIASTKKCDNATINSSLNGKTITLDITKILNSWITNTNNFGLILYNSNSDAKDEFSNISVTINYVDISEVDKNIESEIINMNRAGTIYINDFNGAPTIVRDEIGIDGYIAPVQIQSVLNPYSVNSMFTGSNFRINYESTISYVDNTFIWHTCDGESLYFTPKSTSSSYKEYTAVNSMKNECVLKWYPTNNEYNSNDLEKVNIIDSDEYEYHFNSNGFLKEILTKSNDDSKITIDYLTLNDGSNNYYRFSKITDGSGRVYKFSYNNNQQVSEIGVYRLVNNEYEPLQIKGNNICIKYEYNAESGLLQKVIYPDDVINDENSNEINSSVNYRYDSFNRISSIVTYDGTSMNFTYTNNNDLSMVNKFTVKDNSDTEIQNISFDYTDTYRRTLTNNLLSENSTSQRKVLDFNKSYNLIYLEDFDNKNYFLNYDNNELKSILNNRASNDLISFGNFDYENGKYSETSGYYDYWYEFGDGDIDVNTDTGRRLRSSDDCLVIGNTASATTGAYQIIQGDFKAGEKYIIEAYAKATSALPIKDNRIFSVLVSFSDTEEDIPISSETIAQMDYQPYITGWQLQKQIITIPEDTEELFVYLCYANMEGICCFDSVKLYKYEEKEESTAVDRTEYTYDSYGRLTKESLTEKTPILGSIKAIKEKTYNYSGNDLTSITDNGITTYYNYDSNNGLLLSSGTSNDEDNLNTRYSYNGMGALESIEQVVNQIDNETNNEIDPIQINTTYAYDHDNVVEITHNGFTYYISYDSSGNISDVSIKDNLNSKSIFSFDNQYDNNEISKITYGDGTALFYQKTINDDYYNVVDIYEAEQNSDISKLHYQYEFKYDYDGTLVEYIDKTNNTTSVWYNDAYVIYNCVDDVFLNSINRLLRGEIDFDDLAELPIYQYSETYNGKYLGQSYSLSNTDIFDKSFSTLSTSTSVLVNNLTKTTISDRYYYGTQDITSSSDLSSLINNSNYTVAKTTIDGFGRTEKSSIISMLDGTGVYNKHSYKDLGDKKTSNLLSEYETYYGGVNSSKEEVIESASLLYRRYEYEYNSKGQVTDVYLVDKNLFDEQTLESISDGVNSVKFQHYEYDELGQLIEEVNLKTNTAILYYYDKGGNITEKRVYKNSSSTAAFTFNSNSNELTLLHCTDDIKYGYSDSLWKDLMTSYNGVNITYDNAGNPLNYSGTNLFNATVEGTMEWEGKNLVSFTTQDGQTRYEYKYNADGLRTQKKMLSSNPDGSYTPTSATEYIWNNDIIAGYRIISYESDGSVKTITSMKPVYDDNNNLMGIMYENPNAQDSENSKITIPVLTDGLGNITDVYTSLDGSDTMFHYDYDAYGNCILNFSSMNFEFSGNVPVDILLGIIYIIVLAAIVAGTIIITQQNYRGYLYDMETGLYYNQTRYYSPSWGRFLNCDDVNVLTKDSGEVLGANLFKYCDNDPINYTDSSGFSKLSNLYDESLLSLIGITQTDATKLNIAKTSTQNTIDSKLIESSLALTTQQQEIWDEVFDNHAQTVYKPNGYNYLSSHIVSVGNDNSKMFNSKIKTPYNTKTAKNN